MADRNLYFIDQNTGELIPVTVIDNGDGTYSLSTSGSSGGGSSFDGVLTGPLDRKSDAASISTALSTEDVAILTGMSGKLPATLGQKTKANSLSNTLASDDDLVTAFGAKADSEASNDTGSFSLLALIKRLLNTKLKIGQQTGANSLAVVPASDYNQPIIPITSSPTMVASVTANNTDFISAGSVNIANYKTAVFRVSGLGTATIAAQQSLDGGTTWDNIRVRRSSDGASFQTVSNSAGSNGLFIAGLNGGGLFRIRTTAYTSGTLVVALILSSYSAADDGLPASVLSGNAGSLSIAGSGGTIVSGSTAADGVNSSSQSVYAMSNSHVLNQQGGWDRLRNVHAVSLLASAARTAEATHADQTNYNWHGLLLIVNVTAQSGGSITPAIQVKDSISGSYKTIWTATTPLTAVGTYVYALYPGELSAAGYTEVAQILLSRTWREATAHNNASSITYSISADMQL